MAENADEIGTEETCIGSTFFYVCEHLKLTEIHHRLYILM